MHVEIIKTSELTGDKRAYIGRVGRVVEKYIMPARSRIMFAGGEEVILPEGALKPTKAPRKARAKNNK